MGCTRSVLNREWVFTHQTRMNIRHVHTLRYPLIKCFKEDFFLYAWLWTELTSFIQPPIIIIHLYWVCHRLWMLQVYWFSHKFFDSDASIRAAPIGPQWSRRHNGADSCFLCPQWLVVFRVCPPGSSERCEKPLSNSCFSLCYCCHEEGQGKLLTEHIYIF